MKTVTFVVIKQINIVWLNGKLQSNSNNNWKLCILLSSSSSVGEQSRDAENFQGLFIFLHTL